MTNTQLKSQIDLAITNKVLTSSISPTDVGNSMKDVVDYADQQDLLAMHLNGTEIVTGTKIFNVPLTDSSIYLNNNSDLYHGFVIENSGQSSGINISNNGSGAGLSVSASGGTAIYAENSSPFDCMSLVNLNIGNGLFINNTNAGTGLNLFNGGSGIGFQINNIGTGVGLVINNQSPNVMPPMVIQKDNLDILTVSDLGEITAQKFIKDGAAPGQFLMADGTVTTGSASTFQQVYNASAANPKVLTDAPNGPVTMREGTGLNSNPVFIIQNGGGIDTVTIPGTGNITANQYIKIGYSPDHYLMADGTTTTRNIYKVYTALLTQVGVAAPVATVLENTTGATINWSYGGVGIYTATASAAVFTVNKTIVFTTRSTGAIGFGWAFSGDNTTTTICNFTVQNDGGGGDDRLSKAAVEIRIYN